MRWLENGDKRKIGIRIFIISLLLAICILLFGCVPPPVYRVKAGEKKMNVFEGYDHHEVIQNRQLKSKAEFAKDVEEQAKWFMAHGNWGRCRVRYFETDRIHRKYIGFAVIYFWKERK